VWVRWVGTALFAITELFTLDLEQLLSGDVIEGVESVVPAVLERIPVLDLELDVVQFFLDYLSLPHLDLFLPSGWAVEFLVVFAEIKTPVI
jgi:hypothetical protein